MGPSHNLRSTSVMAGVPSPTATPPVSETAGLLTACAATSFYFLYAKHNLVVCLQHDSLNVVRQFDRHSDDVMFIAADNVSENPGRMIVSYDNAKNAIVWDLITGDEITHIASNEHIRAAAWMRNGNVAFGNSKGEVILFDPATSRDTTARTIYDPITALAPSTDCRTFALGYMNGSVLIASLQPTFVILHTLNTSRAPSPIVTLAWHTSSSRQPADMLATQTIDGDSRVWSIPKATNIDDQPRVVRHLKRTDNWYVGPNWLAWSKNGKVVQFSENETVSYDVKTKRVTCDEVPTPETVKGLAAYGPNGKLFTVGPRGTIQQYDLNVAPPRMIQNVEIVVQQRDKPALPSPSLPTRRRGPGSVRSTSSRKSSNLPVLQESESEEEYAPRPVHQDRRFRDPSPFQGARYRPGPRSTNSRLSRRSGISRRSESGATEMSFGSTMVSENESVFSGLSSVASSMQQNPMVREIVEQRIDLFPYTKARLSDMTYGAPPLPQRRTADALRLNMLSVVFGWSGDVEGLIQDELSRHVPSSTSAFILQKWLGSDDLDMSALMSNDNMSSSDWMFLALASMNATAQSKQLGLSMVQKLLQRQEVHTAAAILIALGEHNDAIEIYVSHKLYIEAILLACLLFPKDWIRMSSIVEALGKHAIEHQHRQVALRCFSCAPEEIIPDESDVEGEPMATTPPSVTKTPVQRPTLVSPATPSNRLAQKNQALKLITTFDKGAQKPGLRMPVMDEDNVATATAPRHAGVPFVPTEQPLKEESPAVVAQPADPIPLLTSARYQPESDRRSIHSRTSKTSRKSRTKAKEPPAAIQTAITNPSVGKVGSGPYIDIFGTGNKLAGLTSPPLTSQSMLTDDSAAESEVDGLDARLAHLGMGPSMNMGMGLGMRAQPAKPLLQLSTDSLAAHNAAYPSNSEMLTAVPAAGNPTREMAFPLPSNPVPRDRSRASARTKESKATRVTEETQRKIGLVSRPIASERASDRGGRPMERIRTTFHEAHEDSSGEDEFYSTRSRTKSQRSQRYDKRSRRDFDDGKLDNRSRRETEDRQYESRQRELDNRSRREYDDRQYDNRSRREYDDRQYDNRSRREYDDRPYDSRSRREFDDRQYDNRSRREYDDRQYDNRSRREYEDRQYENESRRGRGQSSMVHASTREASQTASVIRYTSRTRSPTSPLPMTPAELSNGTPSQSTRDDMSRGRSGGRADAHYRQSSKMSAHKAYPEPEKRALSAMRYSPEHLQEERPRKEASRVRGRAGSRARDVNQEVDTSPPTTYPEEEQHSSILVSRQRSRAREPSVVARSNSKARDNQIEIDRHSNEASRIRRAPSRASSAARGRTEEPRAEISKPEPQATSVRGGFAEHRRERSASRARSKGPARRDESRPPPLAIEDVTSPAGISPRAMPFNAEESAPTATTLNSSMTGKFSISQSVKSVNMGLPSNPRAIIVDDDEPQPQREPERRYVPSALPKHPAFDDSLGKAAALLQAGEQRARSALSDSRSNGHSSIGTSPDPEGPRSRTTPPELQHLARPIGLGTDMGGLIDMRLDTAPKSQPPSPPQERVDRGERVDRHQRGQSIDASSIAGSAVGRIKSPFERIRSVSRSSARNKVRATPQELPPLQISGPMDTRASVAYSSSSRIHPDMERTLAPGSAILPTDTPIIYKSQSQLQAGGLI